MRRHVTYAKWREDKPAEEGYSRELICINTQPAHYDNLNGQPFLEETKEI